MRNVIAIALLFVAVPASARAQSTAPLTVSDALAAVAKLSVTQATDALRDASARIAQARGAARFSFNTLLTAVPMAASPLQYLIAPEVTVDLGSAPRRLGTLQAAQAQLSVSTSTLDATRRAVQMTTIESFFTTAADQSQLGAQSDAFLLAKRSLEVAQLRHDQGVAPQLDIERARAQLAIVQAERDAAQVSLKDDLAALGELVGTPSSAVALPTLPRALPDAATVENAALRANPALRNAQAVYAAAQAAALLARAELSPGITAGIGPGYSRIGTSQAFGPAANLNLNVPLGNRLSHANVAAADAAVLVAKASFDQTRREVMQAVLHARSVTDGAAARLSSLRIADASARRVADADLAGYRLGAVGGADLIVAQTGAANTHAAMENARVQAARAYVNLQLEMGELGL